MPPKSVAAGKQAKKLEFKTVGVVELLQPSLKGITSWLENTSANATEASNASRKRGRQADGDNEPATELQDQLIDDLETLHDLVDQHHVQLLPAAGHIVAHLTPVVLRKRAPIEAWELASTCGAVFGAPVASLLKSVLEHLSVEKLKHPLFSCHRRLTAFTTLLYSSYEFVASPELASLLGGVTMLGLRSALRRLYDIWTPASFTVGGSTGGLPSAALANSGASSSSASGVANEKADASNSKGTHNAASNKGPVLTPKTPLTGEELEAVRNKELDAYRLYAATAATAVAVLTVSRPVLPDLLSTLHLVLEELPAFFAQEWVIALGFEPLPLPVAVRTANRKLRATIGLIVHPTVAPVNLHPVDLSFPSTMAEGGSVSADQARADVAAAVSESVKASGFSGMTNQPPTTTTTAPSKPSATGLRGSDAALDVFFHPTSSASGGAGASSSSTAPAPVASKSTATTSPGAAAQAGAPKSAAEPKPTTTTVPAVAAQGSEDEDNDEIPSIVDSDEDDA